MRLAPIRLMAWCAGAVAGGLSYGWVLSRWTDASYPYSDSLILSFSVAAQILLLERVAENWLGWIVVNTIATPLYCAKGLYLTSFVYAAFWLNAVWGHRQWRLIAERAAALPEREQ